jgi:hypothetical protein
MTDSDPRFSADSERPDPIRWIKDTYLMWLKGDLEPDHMRRGQEFFDKRYPAPAQASKEQITAQVLLAMSDKVGSDTYGVSHALKINKGRAEKAAESIISLFAAQPLAAPVETKADWCEMGSDGWLTLKHSSAGIGDEPHLAIVARLESNWNRHGVKIGEALMRLIACQESGVDVNLSGIDRDLVVYAMARTFAEPQALAMQKALEEIQKIGGPMVSRIARDALAVSRPNCGGES